MVDYSISSLRTFYISEAGYELVNISDNLHVIYEWVRFFKGQIYEWGRF